MGALKKSVKAASKKTAATKSEFEETLDIMKSVKFNQSYMFKYSSRPGTKAAEYTDQIDDDIKQEVQ